jgi:murein DD-endopeptidase MepM/ murein hydrolase activator NlpD
VPLFLSLPLFANAGIFSIGTFWTLAEADMVTEEVRSEQNSQTVSLLKAATNNDPNPAKGGGDILVVDDTALLAGSSVTGDAVSAYRPKSDQISVYEVREGDTLSQIAEMFHVTPNTIRWANDFDGSIHAGQTLVILPVTGVKHTIKSGGTVKDLADLYKADAREIALFNGISIDARLEAGQEIIVPNGELHVEETKPAKKKSGSGGNVASSGSGVSTSGYFIHPAPGGVKTQGIHGYNGVDIGGAIGTTVRAAAGGQVIIARGGGGWNGGYGNYVVVKHDNGTQTLYAHLNSIAVSQGSSVSQGDTIGGLGNTGRSTGPHLHFEVRGGKNPF